jgi:hypothetical protein
MIIAVVHQELQQAALSYSQLHDSSAQRGPLASFEWSYVTLDEVGRSLVEY